MYCSRVVAIVAAIVGLTPIGGGCTETPVLARDWPFDNATARLAPEPNARPAEHFQFNTRVPKKPFNKKNNFLSFDTKNDNIEVGFEFSVPFLSVPVKRSVDSVRNTAQSVMTPLANINSGAIFLAGVMVLAGVTTAYLWRIFSTSQRPPLPGMRSTRRTAAGEEDADDDAVAANRIVEMMVLLEEVLQRYDIDAMVCGQRLVCSMVQNAADNVAHGVGTNADKLVDGLFGIGRVSQLMAGTPLESALMVARSESQRCDRHYTGCRLRDITYELLSQQVFRFS